jgi:hypothetical protein
MTSAQALHMRYTFGPEIEFNHRHADVIKTHLTRNVGALFPEVHDELVAAFEDIIPVKDDGGASALSV